MKIDTQPTRHVFQKQCKLAAVGHFIVWQVDAARKCSVRVQCRFDLAHLLGIDFTESDASFAQHLQTRLHHAAVFFVAQQHGVAVGTVVVQLQIFSQVVQALAAVERQAPEAVAVGQIGFKFAGAPPFPHPDQVGARDRQTELDSCMPAKQAAQYLARHAWSSPRRDTARCDDAGVGKAGFFSSGAAAFKDSDLMAVDRQFVSRGDADDAGSYDCNLHTGF